MPISVGGTRRIVDAKRALAVLVASQGIPAGDVRCRSLRIAQPDAFLYAGAPSPLSPGAMFSGSSNEECVHGRADETMDPQRAGRLARCLVRGLRRCSDSPTPDPIAATCPATALPSGAASATFAVAGYTDRDYDLQVPAGYQCGTPIAVAFVFHGGGGNKAIGKQTTCPGGDTTSPHCIDRVALAAEMAVVFANGTEVPGSDALSPGGIRTWSAGGGIHGYNCVSGNACNNGVDDMAYVHALVASVGTHLSVDPKRVFASGFSNGAALTQRLAWKASDLFAAVAPAAASRTASTSPCQRRCPTGLRATDAARRRRQRWHRSRRPTARASCAAPMRAALPAAICSICRSSAAATTGRAAARSRSPTPRAACRASSSMPARR